MQRARSILKAAFATLRHDPTRRPAPDRKVQDERADTRLMAPTYTSWLEQLRCRSSIQCRTLIVRKSATTAAPALEGTDRSQRAPSLQPDCVDGRDLHHEERCFVQLAASRPPPRGKGDEREDDAGVRRRQLEDLRVAENYLLTAFPGLKVTLLYGFVEAGKIAFEVL